MCYKVRMENDHAIFEMCWAPKSGILASDCSARASHSGRSSTCNLAIDHAMLIMLCDDNAESLFRDSADIDAIRGKS